MENQAVNEKAYIKGAKNKGPVTRKAQTRHAATRPTVELQRGQM
jgi:hypothetical protein